MFCCISVGSENQHITIHILLVHRYKIIINQITHHISYIMENQTQAQGISRREKSRLFWPREDWLEKFLLIG